MTAVRRQVKQHRGQNQPAHHQEIYLPAAASVVLRAGLQREREREISGVSDHHTTTARISVRWRRHVNTHADNAGLTSAQNSAHCVC